MNLPILKCTEEWHLIGNATALICEGSGLETAVTAEKAGLYTLKVRYFHNDWDQWVKLLIQSGDKEHGYMPPLPHGKSETSFKIALYKGKNTIKMTHAFGHELFIKGLELSDAPAELSPSVTPKMSSYFLNQPQRLHFVYKSFHDPLAAVFCEDTPIPFTSHKTEFGRRNVYYSGYDFLENHLYLDLSQVKLIPGRHTITLRFESGKTQEVSLLVFEEYRAYPLKIVSFDVGHGNSSLVKLPNNKTLLVDTGEAAAAQKTVIPYLKRQGIRPDYVLLTHFHSDHFGLMDEILNDSGIEKPNAADAANWVRFPKEERYRRLKNYRYLDSSMLCAYDELHKIWDLGGVELTALCSRFSEDGTPVTPKFTDSVAFNEHNYENATSVSFLLRFHDFGYYHGADNYAYTQEENLAHFKKLGRERELSCQYFYANHHFHCDTSVEFLRAVNPEFVYVPTNCSAFSRSTFIKDYENGLKNAAFEGKRHQSTLLCAEIGTAVAEVTENGEFRLSTFDDPQEII